MASSENEFFKKYSKRIEKAHNENAGKETSYDSSASLPSGINNGIAKLNKIRIMKIDKGDNKGKFMFYADAIVVKPKYHEEIPIEGLRTSIMEVLYDTPDRTRKTIEDHLAWVYNELRKLGIDTNEIDPSDFESIFKELEENSPYIRFRTWSGKPSKEYPEPRVNHVWNGIVEDMEEEDEEDIQENSDSSDDNTDEDNEESSDDKEDTTEEKVDNEDDNNEDNNEDNEEETEEEEQEEENNLPEEGQVYGYFPVDKATGKPGKKQVEVKVVVVNGDTVKAETIKDGKKVIYNKIPFDKLIPLD